MESFGRTCRYNSHPKEAAKLEVLYSSKSFGGLEFLLRSFNSFVSF